MNTKTLGPNGNRNYPWHRWQDGKVRAAQMGKHFNTSLEIFRRVLYNRAKRMGLVVSTRVKGDVVHFQFSTK